MHVETDLETFFQSSVSEFFRWTEQENTGAPRCNQVACRREFRGISKQHAAISTLEPARNSTMEHQQAHSSNNYVSWFEETQRVKEVSEAEGYTPRKIIEKRRFEDRV